MMRSRLCGGRTRRHSFNASKESLMTFPVPVLYHTAMRSDLLATSILGICFLLSGASALAQTPQLKATASDELSGAFVADENNLRKLVELIRKRIGEQASDSKLRFT